MCDKDKHHQSSIHKKVKRRYGSAIQHGRAHHKDHIQQTRRSFLRNTGLFSAGMALTLGGVPINAMTPTPLMMGLNNSNSEDRIMVLIRLKGGNDGLNTIIQRGNSEYYNIRPTLAVQEPDLWALSTDFGMPNETLDLQPFWNNGSMKVVHNVGYPVPNYSHFRSSDIWASSSASNEYVSTGWLGRLLELDYPAFAAAPPVVPPALQIGVQSNLVFQASMNNMALAISNPAEFYQIASTGQLYETNNLGTEERKRELSYIRTVANSAFRYSEVIREAYLSGGNNATFDNNNPLAEQLAIVSRLIKGNLGTKIYMVSIDGFDTHSTQAAAHPQLLTWLAGAVKSFYDDLATAGQAQNVMAMTFSEFGRTIYENASNGTDHGTGAPMLLFGEGIGNGFHGTEPDLVNTDLYGDPYFSVDFRSVYGTALRDWLGVDEEIVDNVIGSDHNKINGLVPTLTPPIGLENTGALWGHNPSLTNLGDIEIKYSLGTRGNVVIQIQDMAGQTLRTILSDFKEKGSYTFTFNPNQYYLPNGNYQYRLLTGGKAYKRPIKIGN